MESSFLLPTYNYFFSKGPSAYKRRLKQAVKIHDAFIFGRLKSFSPGKKQHTILSASRGCDLRDCFQRISITQLLALHELRWTPRYYNLLMVSSILPDVESFKSDFAPLPTDFNSTLPILCISALSFQQSLLQKVLTEFSPDFQCCYVVWL